MTWRGGNSCRNIEVATALRPVLSITPEPLLRPPPPMSPRLKVLRDPAGVPGLQADSTVLCLTDAEYFYYLPIEP